MSKNDIGKTKVDIICDNCKNQFWITLNDAANEIEVKCEKCGTIIKIEDGDDSVKDAIETINNSLENLGRNFK